MADLKLPRHAGEKQVLVKFVDQGDGTFAERFDIGSVASAVAISKDDDSILIYGATDQTGTQKRIIKVADDGTVLIQGVLDVVVSKDNDSILVYGATDQTGVNTRIIKLADDGSQVIQSEKQVWRDDFAGTSLSSDWIVRQVGTGMSVSVGSGLVTINTGTTSGDELELISTRTFSTPCRLVAVFNNISQRIANQEFTIGFVEEDAPVDGGSNLAEIVYSGTVTTTTQVRSQSDGDGPNTQTVTTWISSATAHVDEVEILQDQCFFAAQSVDSIGGRTATIRFHRKLPNPRKRYRVRIRAKNTGTPASATTFSLDSVLVEDYAYLPVEVERSRGGTNSSEALPVFLAAAGAFQNNIIWFIDSLTALGANATFIGTSRDVISVLSGGSGSFRTRIRAAATTDKAGALFLQVSMNNIDWLTVKRVDTTPITDIDGASTVHVATLDEPVYSRYARLAYRNGATAQGFFHLVSSIVWAS